MTIAHEFEYVKPRSLSAAIETLTRYGARAQVLAGGTDLVALLAEDVARPDAVVDIKGIAGLDRIEWKDGVLKIGALATFSDLRDSPVVAAKFPLVREMTGCVASVAVRNRATVVGNICSAVPCCDSGPVLLVYDATVLLAGPHGKRRIALRDWFAGPRKTALKKGEIVTAIAVPLPKSKHAGCFVKLARYEGEDLAQASVTTMALAGHQYRVAFGSVAPRPIRGHRIEAALAGKRFCDELAAAVVRLVPREIAPITDIRASRQYREHMVGVMLDRGLRVAVARLDGNGPEYGLSQI